MRNFATRNLTLENTPKIQGFRNAQLGLCTDSLSDIKNKQTKTRVFASSKMEKDETRVFYESFKICK